MPYMIGVTKIDARLCSAKALEIVKKLPSIINSCIPISLANCVPASKAFTSISIAPVEPLFSYLEPQSISLEHLK